MPLWIVIGVAAAIFVLVIVLAASYNLFSADAADESEGVREVLEPGFTEADVESLRFRPAFRGYRMDEVDQVVSSLGQRIHELNDTVERLSSTEATPEATSPSKIAPETTERE